MHIHPFFCFEAFLSNTGNFPFQVCDRVCRFVKTIPMKYLLSILVIAGLISCTKQTEEAIKTIKYSYGIYGNNTTYLSNIVVFPKIPYPITAEFSVDLHNTNSTGGVGTYIKTVKFTHVVPADSAESTIDTKITYRTWVGNTSYVTTYSNLRVLSVTCQSDRYVFKY